MSNNLGRRELLQAGVAAIGGAALAATMTPARAADGKAYEFLVKDIPYLNNGKARLARL